MALDPGLELVSKANGKHIFRSEIPFGNFGLPFKKSRFPEKISVRGDKIHLSIYIPSEISGFFWVNGKQSLCLPTALRVNYADLFLIVHLKCDVTTVNNYKDKMDRFLFLSNLIN